MYSARFPLRKPLDSRAQVKGALVSRTAWWASILLGLIVLGLCGGCVFRRLRKDLKAMAESLATLTGEVVSASTESRSIMVVVWDADQPSQNTLRYWPMYRPGEFRFVVPAPGHYRIMAFEDRNEDFVFQDHEPAAFYRDAPTAFVTAGQKLENIRIPLTSTDRVDLDFPLDLSSPAEAMTLESLTITYGEIVNIGDPRFTQDNASMGVWEPLRFLKEVGAGMYFLEPFDPAKTPVLFVHGLAGHPGQWKHIIETLDRDRVQPWLFFYPSGVRVQLVSDGLYQMMERLRARYKFKDIHVVAHSMGGLVGRGFLNNLVRQESPMKVPVFASIATPWGGHEAAELGVKHAPAVVPSWLDMLPGSAFQDRLWQTPLPTETTYYLLFGYRGEDRTFMDRNNDGTVALSSALDLRAQAEATKTYGFFEDHVSILANREAACLLNGHLQSRATPSIVRPR